MQHAPLIGPPWLGLCPPLTPPTHPVQRLSPDSMPRRPLLFLALLGLLWGPWCGGARAAGVAAIRGGQESHRQEQDDHDQGTHASPLGPPIASIEIEGLRDLSREALLKAMGLELGAPLDRDALDFALGVVWDVYRARVSTYVRVDELNGEPVSRLLIQVEELPRDLEPRFIGHTSFDDEEIHNAAGLFQGDPVHLDQAPRIKRRLIDAYRSEGFYFAEVREVIREGGIDPETGEDVAPDLIFEIHEGPKVRVKEVVIEGNDHLPDHRVFLLFKRGLKKLAGNKLKGPWFFGWFAKDFVREDLDADLLAMRQVYRDLGYLDVIVDLDHLEFSRDRSWVTIHVVVDEGPQYTVGSVSIQAVEPIDDPNSREDRYQPVDLEIPQEELLELLELQPGVPYESAIERRDRGKLLRRFGEEGFIAHASLPRGDRWEWLEPDLVVDADKPVVHITYRFIQGRRIFLREIRIRGNLFTQDRVVRQYITADEGERADPTEIENSRRRIQSTGYFSDPNNVLEHREPDYFFVDTEDPAWKDLVYQVEEGQVLSFNISGGVSSNNGAFGIVSYSQRNFDITRLPRSPLTLISDVADRRAFHGAGQELRIQASPGTRISFFDIFFREPDIFRLHRDRVSMTLRLSKRRRIFRSHQEQRSVNSIEFGRQIGPDSSVFVGYTFGSIEVDDLDTGGEPVLGDPLTVPRILKDQEGENNLASIDFGYRKSTVDNRRSPRNGARFSWSNEVQLEAVGSDFDYWKSQVSFDFYDEFGDEDSLEVRDRWHFQFAGGVATPFGDTDTVPYSERFFLGGQSRLRGFRFRGVGPNENKFPIGGETLLFSTFEYRRPLVTATQPGTYREIETLHWGVFADVGVLGVDDFDFDPDEVRASVGFLFGLSVPLPISFSVGFPIREGEDDIGQRIGFFIGF